MLMLSIEEDITIAEFKATRKPPEGTVWFCLTYADGPIARKPSTHMRTAVLSLPPGDAEEMDRLINVGIFTHRWGEIGLHEGTLRGFFYRCMNLGVDGANWVPTPRVVKVPLGRA